MVLSPIVDEGVVEREGSKLMGTGERHCCMMRGVSWRFHGFRGWNIYGWALYLGFRTRVFVSGYLL